MAGRKRRRTHKRRRHHSSAGVRSNPRRRRRHYRRNPVGFSVRGIVPFAVSTVVKAGEATVGKMAARTVRGLAGQEAGSIVGSLIEAGVGVVGGMLLKSVNADFGAMFAVGGVQAPLETFAQRALKSSKIPLLENALGDDGFYLGGGYLVASGEYVPGDRDISLPGAVAGYVPGSSGDMGSGYLVASGGY